MQLSKLLMIIFISFLLTAVLACQEHGKKEHEGEGKDEHRSEKSEGHDEEGEESGTELGLNDTYDVVRNGAHLVLAYDAESNSFVGTVTNTTEKVLEKVRVEVHTSNGKEIGPSTPGDLKPGESRKIVLKAESKGFERWNAHPEVGSSEGGHGEESRGEHSREGREGKGEHEG